MLYQESSLLRMKGYPLELHCAPSFCYKWYLNNRIAKIKIDFIEMLLTVYVPKKNNFHMYHSEFRVIILFVERKSMYHTNLG